MYYRPIAAEPNIGTSSGAQVLLLHVIDVATRFALAKVVDSRNERDLCKGFEEVWIGLFGPPQYLVMDEETGVHSSRYTADWAECLQIQLKFKAPRQEAWIIERHNELLRQQLHRMETQLQTEGRTVRFGQTLNQALFAKNSLLTYNGHTPYQAVLGRQPVLLPSFDTPNPQDVDQQRLREIAVEAIVQEHSRSRIQRALRHHTRPPLEWKELEPGSSVDIWFEPANKETSGWRGPAKVVSLQPDEGNVTVRWQGRTLDRRPQEVRKHVIFSCFYAGLPSHDLWTTVRQWSEQVDTMIIVGIVATSKGWGYTSSSLKPQGRVFLAILRLLATALGMPPHFAVRVGCGQQTSPYLKEYSPM